mmetsp:Transcript_21535/g.37841  ORF Transcript_21535/g.37841 Transcript_21535/m.37841 type:complete len:273 (+) Transcript_21535:245-1063(+)
MSKAPWFFSRVVPQGDLASERDMRGHLQAALFAAQLDCTGFRCEFPLRQNGRGLVPDPQLVGREFLTFDPDASVEFGGFFEHVRDQTGRPRLPDEMVALLETQNDSLRNHIDFAIARAQACPSTVLSQWFCDKGALQGTPQLIAPLSWRSPPALDVHAGLVLDIEVHDSSDDSSSDEFRDSKGPTVSYHARTILPLDMIFSNVFVLWPLGGHWLTATHEQVKASPWLEHQPEERDGEDGDRLEDELPDEAGPPLALLDVRPPQPHGVQGQPG